MFKELTIFVAINGGLSLALRLGQALWPEVFWTFAAGLGTALVILIANLLRARVAKDFRWLYRAIVVLNLAALVLSSNTSFLTSMGVFFRVLYRLIGS